VLIKLAEYAARLNVAPQAVRKAIADGRISEGARRETAEETRGRPGRPGWLINPEIADREWGQNTAPQKRHSAEIRNGRQRQMAEKAAAGGRGMASPPPPAAGAGMPSQAQGQAIKTAYQAKLLQLEFEQKSGQLVNVEEMNRKRFESGRQVRDAVLRIGPQMIGEVAKAAGGMTTDQRAEVLLVIQRYLVQALEALADGAGQG
jgi:hypothetical protein